MRRDELMDDVIVLPRTSFWISEWELDCFWRETDAGEESSEPIYTVDWAGLQINQGHKSHGNDQLK